jgi:hypothetical protein
LAADHNSVDKALLALAVLGSELRRGSFRIISNLIADDVAKPNKPKPPLKKCKLNTAQDIEHGVIAGCQAAIALLLFFTGLN